MTPVDQALLPVGHTLLPVAQTFLELQKEMEREMIADAVWLSPLIALGLATAGGVVLSVFLPRERQGWAAGFVCALHLVAAALVPLVWLAKGFRPAMTGTVVIDGLSLTLIALIGVSGAVCVALVRPALAGTDREGELYAMLAGTSLAAGVLAAANDIAVLALSLGLLSLGSFVMTGYLRAASRSNEAAMKYYIYGTVAGAAMVYGLSWWYGVAGSTYLERIGSALQGAPDAMVIASTALVVVGLGYKAALVPFHWWTPDAYEGAPLPVAAYLSVLPKAAGLAALARVLSEALPDGAVGWPTAVAVIAAATMTLGVLAAMTQRNVVRLLAYSSIAQAGFLLIGVAAMTGSDEGLPGLVYYLLAYSATNLAAFAVVLAVQRETGSVDVEAFTGLGRRHPWWTAALIISFMSLLGLPPLSGFFGKLEVFTAAIDASQAWLAVVGVVATVVSLYPYLRVMAPAVVQDPRGPAAVPAAGTGAWLGAALVVTTVATVAFGVGAQPLLDLARESTVLSAS